MNPCTINTWLNWYASQWDLFVESFIDLQEFPSLESKLFFKKADDKSYLVFRKLTQIIDLISLDFYRLQYSNREIVASVLILTLLESIGSIHMSTFNIIHNIESKFNVFKIKSILEDLSTKEEERILINTFIDFLFQSFNYQLEDIDKTLQYVSDFFFFIKDVNIDIPITVQMAPEEDTDINNGHYEDFLSYQTHNKTNYNYIKQNIHV